MNIRQSFADLISQTLPRSEARMLLSHVLKRGHAWLVAHDDYELSGDELAQVCALAAKRIAGEPMAYLLGVREFYGRAFLCTPAALIPRPETELLVDLALAQIPATAPLRGLDQSPVRVLDQAPLRVLDIGTGTGCIAITIALERPHASVNAIDISPDALALAGENAQRLGASVSFVDSNWFAGLPPESQFDLILSNPPYIVPGDAHLSQGDLRFEPTVALADAVDGLESYRQLAQGAKKHLKPGGVLIVEHGFDQGGSVPALFRAAGFYEVTMHRDLANQPRVTSCRKPPPR